MDVAMTQEMLDVLAGLKGKTLKSLEYEPEAFDGSETYELVKVNLGGSAIMLTCLWQLEPVFDDMGDAAPLLCEAANPTAPLYDPRPGESLRSRRYLVGERITGVEVVRERVTDLGYGDTFLMDVTVAIRTRYRTVAVSKTAFDTEELAVHLDGIPDVDAASIQPTDDIWLQLEGGEPVFGVEREVIVL